MTRTVGADRRGYPAIVFVGVHREAEAPFRFLLESGEAVRGLVTLTPEIAASVSGAVDLASVATAGGVPVLRVRDVNDAECVRWIRGFQPDVLLVVGWTRLVSKELLAVPRLAALGFHASLLPKYRGRAPINWALINGETETGNTLMVLAPGADEGDLVAQRRIPIGDEDDCATLYDKVAATEVDMLAELLPQLRTGVFPGTKQDSGSASVMPRRRPADGLIDWSISSKRVRDWVRAQTHPYPGAFSYVGFRKVWFWKVEIVADSTAPPRAESGTIARDAAGWPLIATGDGWVRAVSVQAEGEPVVAGSAASSTFLAPSFRTSVDGRR